MHYTCSACECRYLWELKLHEVGSHLTWVLGTEFRSFLRTIPVLNHCSISPVPSIKPNTSVWARDEKDPRQVFNCALTSRVCVLGSPLPRLVSFSCIVNYLTRFPWQTRTDCTWHCTPFTDDGFDPETFAISLKVKALATSSLEAESWCLRCKNDAFFTSSQSIFKTEPVNGFHFLRYSGVRSLTPGPLSDSVRLSGVCAF